MLSEDTAEVTLSARHPLAILLLASASALFAHPAHAAWSPTGNPICNTPGDVSVPVSLPGEFYFPAGLSRSLDVFWQDSRNGAADIYTGGISDVPPPDPAPGTPGRLLVSGPGDHFPCGVVHVEPVLCLSQFACTPYVLVWAELPTTGGAQVRALRSFDQGADWGPNGVAVAEGSDGQIDPVVASDGGQGVIVAWLSVGSLHRWVYAQHLDGHGVAQWGAAGVPVGTDTTVQDAPQIVSDGAGGAYVLRFNPHGSAPTLALLRIGPDGATAAGWPGAGVQLGSGTLVGWQPLLRTASDGVWVVWSQLAPLSDATPRTKPFATRVLGSGAPAAGFSLAGSPVAPALDGEAIATDAAVGPDNDIAIVYEYTQMLPGPASSGTDLRSRLILGDGNDAPGWPATGVVVCDEPGTQSQGRVLYAGGSAMFAWTDERSGEKDIYAQMLLHGGTPSPDWPVTGLAVCTVPGAQQDPVVGPNAVGGGLIVWRDARDFATTGWDLYGQTVSGDGRLDAPPEPPRAFALSAGRPNPARQDVRFRLSLPESRAVRFDVLDVVGRFVHRERLTLPAGEQDLAWSLTDSRGERVHPGLYLVRVQAGTGSGTRRVVVTQ